MDRPTRFEHNQWVGDKRNQVVHDIDASDETDAIADLMRSEAYLCFGPDTVVEARNRGYRPCPVCAADRRAE
jgi:hypothetical protein